MMRMVTFKKGSFCSLSPANASFSLGPVSAFSPFGEVDKQAATLFHEEYGM
ncbi:MAG: hypothetical protein JRI80_05785 [Deltaproteobacteria bacterium]|nr:hypothetical protein [Deltaproteobacteria bacterium]